MTWQQRAQLWEVCPGRGAPPLSDRAWGGGEYVEDRWIIVTGDSLLKGTKTQCANFSRKPAASLGPGLKT